MKFVFVILLIIFGVQSIPWSTLVNPDLDDLWETFKTNYHKKYDGETERMRRQIWEINVNIIHLHNVQHDLGLSQYSMGVNQFADLTHQEFKTLYLGNRFVARKTNNGRSSHTTQKTDLPDSVNWVKKGYVTKVKNQVRMVVVFLKNHGFYHPIQQQCGSCWAFSTTGSTEGQYFRKTKRLISFSEQQLVDCSQEFGNLGCNGGLMDSAFKYIMKYGIEKEVTYPYTAQVSFCIL